MKLKKEGEAEVPDINNIKRRLINRRLKISH